MTPARSWLTGGLGIVIVVAAAKLLLHLATASRYGYFGDELYFMACGEHLDWGYVDQPPLVGLAAWLVRHTLGTSLLAMRLPMKALGTHQSYWLWGPGDPGKDVLIVLGDRKEGLGRWCGDVDLDGRLGERARARVPAAPPGPRRDVA